MSHCTGPLRVRGVALIVCNPHGHILMLQEFESKPYLGKYPRMFSPPMETSQEDEQDSSTLLRLVDEELPGLAHHIVIENTRYGVYRIVPGVWVSLYRGRMSSSLLPTLNEQSNKEVGGYMWLAPHDALSLWLRQGAREMLTDYVENRRGVVCRYCRPTTLETLDQS